MFEERFSFRRSSDLPPPIPSKEGITTLNRTGTKPKVATTSSLGSPRTHPSPRLTTSHWESKDSSFETIESSTKEDTCYKDNFLLHDTLKTLAVKESTQRAANMTINRFICLTIIITNLMSISILILGTILVMNCMSPNGAINNHPEHLTNHHLDHLPRFVDKVQRETESLTMKDNPSYQPLTSTYHPVDQISPVDQILPVDQPVHTLKSDLKDTDVAADTYKIQIKVSQPSNQSMDQTEEDFWLN